MAKELSKINVLVVDDQPEWWTHFESRSKTSPTSFVDIKTCSSFQDGLERLQSDRNIDIVVVDLFLDHNQLAFDFIEAAKRNGHFLPFVITSQMVRESALSKESSHIEQYVHSQATDFIEKRELKGLAVFQERLRDRLNDFLNTLRGLLHMYISEQIAKDERMLLANNQILWLSKLLSTYSHRVKSKSFDRICSSITTLSEECTSLSQKSLAQFVTSNLADVLALKGAEPDSPDARTEKFLSLEDYIPSDRKETKVRSIVRSLEKLSLLKNPQMEKIQQHIHSLVEAGRGLDNSTLELMLLELASHFGRRGREDYGVEVMYCLSRIYAKVGPENRIPIVDMLIANYLLNIGRRGQAFAFLRSARAASRLMNDEKLKTLIEAAIFLTRDELSTEAQRQLP